MRWIHHRGYDYGRYLPMPRQIHGFVRNKPSRIRRLVDRLCGPRSWIRPSPVTESQVRAVHTERVVRDLSRPRAMAIALELPPLALAPSALVRHIAVKPQLLAAGGTVRGLRAAVAGDWAINVSGGFHHARPDLSHGYCLINDVAIAVATLRADGIMAGDGPQLAIIDLDLHQGDGNAAAFAEDPSVFTASLHQGSAFPVPKLASDLDIGLADNTSDGVYLAAVDELCAGVRAACEPEVIVYVAGTDPFVGDRQGGLRVSFDGMVERDRRVARLARSLSAGLLVLPAGGYSEASPDIAAAGYHAIAELAP